MTALGFLSRNRARLERDLAGSVRRTWTSPVTIGLGSALRGALAKHARGDLLDAGCGTMPYRSHILPRLASYTGFDIERRAPEVTIGDVQQMTAVGDGTADVILCSEVLEHVPRPEAALAEFRRVLRPGGTLILSTPFLARLHEEPHDYFRYTRHGLVTMLAQTRFRVQTIEPTGGLFSFLGHQPAIVLCSTAWPIPVVRDIVLVLVALGITLPCRFLDLVTRNAAKFPTGYVVVAEPV